MAKIKPGFKSIKLIFDYGEKRKEYKFDAKYLLRFSHGNLFKVDKRCYATFDTMFIVLSHNIMIIGGNEVYNNPRSINQIIFEYKNKKVVLDVPFEGSDCDILPINYSQYNMLFDNGDLGISFRGQDQADFINLIGRGAYDDGRIA